MLETGGDTFLRAPIRQAWQEAGPEPALALGDSLGPYRIVRELGSGGMGIAYLAERADEQFHKRVALKVMRVGLMDTQASARFRVERQILAALEHPNIARLLDGGETPGGAPYLVMEYIDGKRLTDACAGLAMRDRLTLFQKVCAAVRHAHANLIVHRDIKPSNILVTADGEPKLLDFGIAKALEAGTESVETRTGHTPFTPRYASPEQMLGRPATTSCDVYSLGVVLYELLSGRVPFPETNVAELAQAIATRSPAQPGAGPDLDAIALKAIRKEPAERYTSVEELSRDIDRYLAGFPVEARKGTWRYRARKFVGRNKWAVGLAAVLGIAVIGFGIALAIFARRADEQRQTAEQVAGFLSNIFEAVDPVNAQGREPTARDVLAQGAARIDKELAGQPQAQGMLLDILGRTYRNMGDTDQARQLFNRSLAVRRNAFGEDSAETAEVLQGLGQLEQQSGNYATADPILRRCLEVQIREFGEESAEAANTRNLLGLNLFYLDKLDEAEEVLRHALTTLERIAGERDRVYGLVLNNLALVLLNKGKALEAEQMFRTLLRISEAAFGPNHPSTALANANLGSSLLQQERWADAEPVIQRGPAIRRKLYPEGHVDVAFSLGNYLNVLNGLGRTEESDGVFRELEPLRMRTQGAKALSVRTDRIRYAISLSLRGRHTEALALAEPNVAALRQDATPMSDSIAGGVVNLSRIQEAAGQYAAAEAGFREALAMYEKTKGPDNPFYTASTRLHLARVLEHGGKTEEARAMVAYARASRQNLPPEHPLRTSLR